MFGITLKVLVHTGVSIIPTLKIIIRQEFNNFKLNLNVKADKMYCFYKYFFTKLFLIFCLLVCNTKTYSQYVKPVFKDYSKDLPPLYKTESEAISILIGKDEKEVRDYYFKLHEISNRNNALIIEESADVSGNMILTLKSPSTVERYSQSLALSTVFQRVNAKETVIKELIIGTGISIIKNLNFVKDNFKKLDYNIWYKEFPENKELTIVVIFKPEDDLYSIEYRLVSTLNFKSGKY